MAAESRTKRDDPYAGLRTRARWRPEAASDVLLDWSRSGESLPVFARRHRLSVVRLRRWHERLAGAATHRRQEGSAAGLVPLVVRSPAPHVALERPAKKFEVSLEVDGIRVEVDSQGTDPHWVAALVHELRGGRT